MLVLREHMNARKRVFLFTIAGCLLAVRAAASDDDVESRKLFAQTTWGGVYTCSAIDERLHPENGNAQQTVLRVFERGYAIPKAHGQSFRKLASEKVAALAAEGRLARYVEANCPHAEVGYMTTGK
jgi:hypothetical protein